MLGHPTYILEVLRLLRVDASACWACERHVGGLFGSNLVVSVKKTTSGWCWVRPCRSTRFHGRQKIAGTLRHCPATVSQPPHARGWLNPKFPTQNAPPSHMRSRAANVIHSTRERASSQHGLLLIDLA